MVVAQVGVWRYRYSRKIGVTRVSTGRTGSFHVVASRCSHCASGVSTRRFWPSWTFISIAPRCTSTPLDASVDELGNHLVCDLVLLLHRLLLPRGGVPRVVCRALRGGRVGMLGDTMLSLLNYRKGGYVRLHVSLAQHHGL